MNSKNIKKHMNAKMRDWIDSISDETVKKAIKENVLITGGALVSLLTGEKVHDYDVYFRTKESLLIVVEYYVSKWNESHADKPVSIVHGAEMERCFGEDNGAVKCFVKSKGIADEDEEKKSDLSYNFDSTDQFSDVESEELPEETQEEKEEAKEKYRPRFITSNAISLSDKIQIVTRFVGDVGEIHKNFDFAHCTCSWSIWDDEVFLPQKAIECIINKEMYYIGSKYPLCSIVRTRKYLERGYHINAGQYVKMCMQLNELNLKDVRVLEDQLTGVDTAYFKVMIDALTQRQEETGTDTVDMGYAIELINKLF